VNTAIRFHSLLAEAMDRFVAFKRTEGYDYTDQARTLSYFDRFLAAEGGPAEGPALTADLLRRYVATTGNLTAFSRQTRIASLREFSRWWQARCAGSAILPKGILPRHSRSARFFPIAPEQIEDLMAAAPAVLAADRMRARSTGTIVGLLYCAGLRIAEALNLTPRDIGTEGSTLHVTKGKFGKDRLVPIDPSTHTALTSYLALRRRCANLSDWAALFIDASGAALTRSQVYNDFRRLCRHGKVWGDPPPRLHDLRHNYACRRLALWRQAGMDVNAMLPILATAMGHVNVYATQRYLHLDAVALRHAAALFNTYVATHRESRP
jgi:integrase/recombinase XerD